MRGRRGSRREEESLRRDQYDLDQRSSAAHRRNQRQVIGDPRQAASGFRERMREDYISSVDDLTGAYEQGASAVRAQRSGIERRARSMAASRAAEAMGNLTQRPGAGSAMIMSQVGADANRDAEAALQQQTDREIKADIRSKQAITEGIAEKRKAGDVSEDLQEDISKGKAAITDAILNQWDSFLGMGENSESKAVQLAISQAKSPQAAIALWEYAKQQGVKDPGPKPSGVTYG